MVRVCSPRIVASVVGHRGRLGRGGVVIVVKVKMLSSRSPVVVKVEKGGNHVLFVLWVCGSPCTGSSGCLLWCLQGMALLILGLRSLELEAGRF